MNQLSPAQPVLTLASCRAVALLVDGENLSSEYSGQIITTTSREIGKIAVQRVYGDVTRLNGWLSAPGFRAMHAHAGKNVTDMLMTVEAMELSFGGQIDGFALATRDRDFAPLAWSLRARGFPVFGLLPGDAAPDHLRKCFDRYATLLPVAKVAPAVAQPPAGSATPPRPKPAAPKAAEPSAPAPSDIARIEAAVRATLAKGPVSPQQFGHAMTQLKLSIPKPNTRWQSWLRANAPYVVIGNSDTGTHFALKP